MTIKLVNGQNRYSDTSVRAPHIHIVHTRWVRVILYYLLGIILYHKTWWCLYAAAGIVSHCLLMMRRRMQAAMLRMTVNMVTMVGSTMSCSTARPDPDPPLSWSED